MGSSGQWGNDRLKLALWPVARLFDLLSVQVSEEASIVANAPSPAYRREFLRRLGRNIYGRGLGLVGKAVLDKPTLVADETWDTLILLDACRYDTLAEVWEAQMENSAVVRSATSPGTTTLLWLKANFVENPRRARMSDVTVIAGNPYISRAYFEVQGWPYPFRDSVDVWKTEWDETLEAVPPAAVFEAAAKVKEGRLLVHFYQPHFPIILHPEIDWGALERGEISLEKIRGAYEDNLRLVLDYALRLVEAIRGRVVITADHGELFGEYGLYSHPHGVYVPELVTVPWIELQGGETHPSPRKNEGGRDL